MLAARRRRDDPSARRRRDADAGDLARDPELQFRPHDHRCDGIVITPSHNPPARRRLQVQPAQRRPGRLGRHLLDRGPRQRLLRSGNAAIKRVPFAEAIRASTTLEVDFVEPYVADLASVIDMEAIRAAGLKLGVDPLGGAAVHYWQPIADRYGLDITVTNPAIDPTFRFMTLDHDGKIRMDCSSPYAMASLVKLKDRFDLAFGNDPDSDRHGIVTRSIGLMNPNHYLAVAIRYLLTHRDRWPAHAKVGKTLVSSSLIDRVVNSLKRPLAEVPVGFKWFAPGLLDGSFCFGGEESAGASFLRRDGTVWTTDKDGPILDLLAAEILARTGKDPGEHYQELTAEFGTPFYTRIDAAATPEQKARLQKLDPSDVKAAELAGEPIVAKLTRAPANERRDRRAQGRRRERLVRGAAFRHREHLQDLRRELPRPGPPGRHRRGSREDRDRRTRPFLNRRLTRKRGARS